MTAFCPRCGNPMIVGPMGHWVCPKCDYEGSGKSPSRPGPKPSPEPSPFPSPNPGPMGGLKCPKCGAQIPPGQTRCPQCGYQLPTLV